MPTPFLQRQFAELKRRGVFRAAAIYGAVAFAEKTFAALDRLAREPVRPSYRWEVVWWDKADAIRKHPQFARWAQTMGLIDYWKTNGFPPFCSASGSSVQCR